MRKTDRLLKDQLIHFIQAILWAVFGFIGLWGRIAALRTPRPAFDPEEIRRILVIRLDLLGDVLLSMPAVEAIHERYPQAELWMMTLPYTADIPKSYSFVTGVITLDINTIRSPKSLLHPSTLVSWIRTYRLLRAQNFDLCVSLFGLMASIWGFLSGATHRLGYQRESYPLLHTRTLPGMRYDHRQHEVKWCLNLAELAGADIESRYMHLDIDPESARRSGAWLEEAGMDSNTLLIGIHVGSINGSAKRWPVSHWAELIDRLHGTFGARVILTGSKSEQALANQVCHRTINKPIMLAGKTSINELAGVLNRCSLVLSGDSGPLHMAVALGRPTLSFYGPTDPVISGPYPRPDQISVVLRTGIGCSPCYNALATADCPYGNTVCMHHLTVDHAMKAISKIIASLGVADRSISTAPLTPNG